MGGPGSGRKPLPAAVKIANGTWRAKDGAIGEQIKPAGKPVMPADFDGEAAAHWQKNVPKLIELGIATDLDEDALAAMCEAWAKYRSGQHGAGVALERWLKLSSLFGMNPAERSRMRISKPSGGVRTRKA